MNPRIGSRHRLPGNRKILPLIPIPWRIAMLLIDLRKCIRRYGTNWPWLLRRLAFLHKIGGFHPREALGDGLLDPMVTETALIGTISRRDLERMQDRVNPLRMECLTEDKVVFYAIAPLWGCLYHVNWELSPAMPASRWIGVLSLTPPIGGHSWMNSHGNSS